MIVAIFGLGNLAIIKRYS